MTQPAPRRGRPRSAEADRAILGAALAVASEVGLAAMTMEAVATRAGVGKATVYRRWSAKEDLFADALRSVMGDMELPPDRGDFRADWMAIIGQELERITPRAVTVVPRLLADAAGEPALHQLIYDTLIAPRRRIGEELVRRAVARGELRADVDPAFVVDLLIGPMIYRALISGQGMATMTGRMDRILDAVLPGLTP